MIDDIFYEPGPLKSCWAYEGEETGMDSELMGTGYKAVVPVDRFAVGASHRGKERFVVVAFEDESGWQSDTFCLTVDGARQLAKRLREFARIATKGTGSN